jgi:hypothetical protein
MIEIRAAGVSAFAFVSDSEAVREIFAGDGAATFSSPFYRRAP